RRWTSKPGLLFSLRLDKPLPGLLPVKRMSMTATPPAAARKPHSYTRHGRTVEDPYAWLKDPSYPTVNDPEILDYLKAENAYFEAQMAPQADLVETLFQEMKGRIKEDDAGVPQKDGDWLYWWAFQPGGQYRLWYRKPVAGGEARLLLDEPAE